LLLVASVLSASCARPAKEHPVETSADGAVASSSAPAAQAAAPDSTPAPLAPPAGSAPAAATAVAEGSTGSAYFGCGEPIPLAKLWDETTESQVFEAISAAKSCAAEHGRRLLLEFVAPWCEDCQEMAKLDETALVAATLKQRFERVRINVGKWDRHEGLRNTFDVHALATYIVIDPKTSKQLAKTTLEPITKKGQRISAEQWAAWLNAH
ncbi:MAG TPA: thioredoxin family protein, partial [Polyangiaceae bacterium]|nr:thioredoxin family protein [Polyangiaceae bacterium]